MSPPNVAHKAPGGADATPAIQSRQWLLERYGIFAWLVLAAAAPLLLMWGTRADAAGIAVYIALTGLGWLVARRSGALGARLHLLLMFPYWGWYIGLAGALPMRLGAGVAEYALLLVFPLLTLVAVEGLPGGAAGVVLATAGLFWRWTALDARVEGLFLLSTAVLIGLVFRRLTRELDQAHERMRHMAYHDELTRLPNRRELQARARDWMTADSRGALLFVDLDRFKTVNDVMGHGRGDEVLRMVGARMQSLCGDAQLLARIGGDEFAVLMHHVEEQEASELAGRLLSAVREPCDVAGRTVHVGASIGIALWPKHGRDLEALMKYADVAMFHAKQDDIPIAVHRPKRDGDTLDSRGLEVDLYRALENDELCLQYQPVKNPHDDEIVGAEALVRWRHPDKGVLSPASFIELAEETGHIIAIDRWVLRHALAQLRVWGEHGYEGFVAVNVSARSLEDEDFLSDLALALEEEKATPARLILEITESAAMLDPEASLRQLGAVKTLGVRVAIDDFGMGYSSLAYLKRFPASHVKLDRSFTRGIGKHPRDEEIIELVLQLARRFELEVVAEGVEDSAQLAWLTKRGCDLVQGFGIARPMGPGEFVTTCLGISTELEVATPSNRGATRLRGAARARRSLNPRRAG